MGALCSKGPKDNVGVPHGRLVDYKQEDDKGPTEIININVVNDGGNVSGNSKFATYLNQCRSKGEKFVDQEFPATQASLITDWNEEAEEVRDHAPEWRSIHWMRAEDIPELNREAGGLALFVDKIEPSDIQQGGLGDCYFLSVLSMLAENPHRVRKLFAHHEVLPEGIYGVNLTKNGEAVEVVVDSFLPCKEQKPCFSRAHGSELWVLILEKVWAKLHGDYCRIIGGLSD